MRNATEHFYNEIYSYYYHAVGKLINIALKGELTPERESKVLHEESSFSGDLVLDKLHVFNEWFLMHDKLTKVEEDYIYQTNIRCEYKRPMTILEKRWMKSIVSDPRIKLFGVNLDSALADVDPLFKPEDFVSIGKYNNGDNFDDKEYIKNFRLILKAIKEEWGVKLLSENRHGEVSPQPYIFIPEHIEYSELEDKFSVYGYSPNQYGDSIVRISRIKQCELCERQDRMVNKCTKKGNLTILLEGENAYTQNALERILIEFSHYNKRVKETEGGDYLIDLEYAADEEKELTILRLMPFAQYIQVISPDSIKNEMRDRIRKQMDLFRFNKRE